MKPKLLPEDVPTTISNTKHSARSFIRLTLTCNGFTNGWVSTCIPDSMLPTLCLQNVDRSYT